MTGLKSIEQGAPEVPEERIPFEVVGRPRAGAAWQLPAWVTAKSPDRPVTDFVDHPLNLPRSPGLARALRGLTGILGSLEYALIDVLIGLFSWLKERMPGEPPGASGA